MKREEINTEVVRAISSSKLSDLYSIRHGEAESKFDTWLEEVKREAREQSLESFRQGTLNIVPMRRPLP